jgi:hypothetical protein
MTDTSICDFPYADERGVAHPHVVILGAGASRAAVPHGEDSGRVLPLMNDFVTSVDGLQEVLAGAGVRTGYQDFESLYDDLVSSGKYPDLVSRIEGLVFKYFSGMALPDHATVYDYLVLSLRKKDMIASFNWDPLLLHALHRNFDVGDQPDVVFLHGNVGIGLCPEHLERGYAGLWCPTCKKQFQNCRLLFPVKHKDYAQDPFIAGQWQYFRDALSRAYIVSIFGYSAPVADTEARNLMLNAWRDCRVRQMAHVEIIDIRPKRDLRLAWDEFLGEHYTIVRTFRKTHFSWWPRRSCEARFQMHCLCRPTKRTTGFPRLRNLSRLQRWIRPLAEEERICEKEGKPLSCFANGV